MIKSIQVLESELSLILRRILDLKFKLIFTLVFFANILFSNAADLSCQEFLNEALSSTGQELVRIYAGPGVVIPRQIECIYCGEGSLMPASLKDPRITITNSTADIESLKQQSGGQAPDFLGASIKCTNCAGHSPLWELGRAGQPPRPAAITTRLEILTDETKGKRYVMLPKEYEELADKDSEMNKLARAQHIAICPSCSVTTMTDSRPAAGLNCPPCGGHIPQSNIYNTGELLAASDKNTKNTVNRNASGPGETTFSKRNIQPAPEKRPRGQKSSSVSADSVSPVPTLSVVKQGRLAISDFTKKWIAGGVTALAVLSGSTYYYNNAPMMAEGMVVDITNQTARVKFQETPYYNLVSNLKTYEVNILLDGVNSLPGEQPIEILEGDRVTIHYTWSDLHILPFIFHPYSGAEFFDGSYIHGSGIQ